MAAVDKRPKGFIVKTELGNIGLDFRHDSAPLTTAHIAKLISEKLFNGVCFYRSDFVIQTGQDIFSACLLIS